VKRSEALDYRDTEAAIGTVALLGSAGVVFVFVCPTGENPTATIRLGPLAALWSRPTARSIDVTRTASSTASRTLPHSSFSRTWTCRKAIFSRQAKPSRECPTLRSFPTLSTRHTGCRPTWQRAARSWQPKDCPAPGLSCQG